MICLVPSPEETAQLEQARRTRPKIAERCHYVLLNAEGWSVPHIAQRLDRNEHTIRTWLKAYQTTGLQGLQTPRNPGVQPPKARASPHTLSACWPKVQATSALLRTAGQSTSSAIISHSTQAMSVTQPCAASYRRVAEIVATIHTRQTERPVEVVWVDASHFTNAPSVQRGWFRKGIQAKVPTPAKRQSATLVGALHLRTQRFYWKRAERGTSKIFLAFLHQLHQRFPQALLIVILDNANIHKSRAVKRFLKQHTWVALEHL